MTGTVGDVVRCRYCTLQIRPGCGEHGSGWIGAGGEPCRPDAPGHAPQEPPPMWRVALDRDGNVIARTIVPGASTASEQRVIDAINAEHGRTVYRLDPLED